MFRAAITVIGGGIEIANAVFPGAGNQIVRLSSRAGAVEPADLGTAEAENRKRQARAGQRAAVGQKHNFT